MTYYLRLVVALLVLTLPASALTTVTDTIYSATGSLVSGSITIKWTEFTVPGPRTIAAGTLQVAVRNGAFTVALEPGDTATPVAIAYTAEYRLSDGTRRLERWLVPTSGTAVTISTVRLATATVTPSALSLSQLSPIGAAKGDLIGFGTSWGLLSGGTNGQVLAKDSTADRGLAWVEPDSGPAGPQGPAGAAGAQGPSGVVAATSPITYDGDTDTVACPTCSLSGHNHDLTYQPLDSDLSDLAALACTEGQIAKRNDKGVWICGTDETGGGGSAPVMFSATGVGHYWPFGNRPDPTDYQVGNGYGAYGNKLIFWEFTVPATITVGKLYTQAGGSETAGRHLAFGIWDSTGTLVTNGNSSTWTAAATYEYINVSFPATGAVLTAGTYYLGFSADTGSGAVSVAAFGSGGMTFGSLLWDYVYGLGGATSLRQSFRDGSVSTGTATIVMPSTMGAASARVPSATGPNGHLEPKVLFLP